MHASLLLCKDFYWDGCLDDEKDAPLMVVAYWLAPLLASPPHLCPGGHAGAETAGVGQLANSGQVYRRFWAGAEKMQGRIRVSLVRAEGVCVKNDPGGEREDRR